MSGLRTTIWLHQDCIYSHLKAWFFHFLKKKEEGETKPRFKTIEIGETKFKLRPNSFDSVAILENWILKEYTRIPDLIKGNMTIIDIGAHIGATSIFLATQEENVKIFSFEPLPENFELLKYNIKLNGLQDKIFPFRLGVARKKGKRLFFRERVNLGASSLFPRNHQSTKKEMIKCITLKEIFNLNKIRTCGLLKIDCEGAELEILLNTPRSIFKKIKNIVLEYHLKKAEMQKLRKFLELNHFKVWLDRGVTTPFLKYFVKAPLLYAKAL